MSRRPGTPRSPFFRPESRRKTPACGGSNSLSRRLHHETLEKRELLAADLLAIRPDAGALIAEGTRLSTPPREFSLLFNGDANLAESSINNDSIRLVRAGEDATFGTADDVRVSLGYVGFVEPGDTSADNLHKIVLRPASTASANTTDPSFAFPDDLYRIEIIGSGTNPLEDRNGVPFNGGQDSITPFRLDRGIQVIAVIPQPIERQTDGSLVVHDKRIDVYFDDQEIAVAVAENSAFYRLVDTAGPASTAINPDSVTYFPSENRVQLTFAAIPTATHRLDVGSSLAPTGSTGVLTQTFTGEIGTSFKDLLTTGAAGNIGNLSSGTSVRVASVISPAGAIALPTRPGGLDEPGHRQIQLEAHYGSSGLGPVVPAAIPTRYYSFPSTFPTNGAGISYQNFISPSEKEIVRGILEIYAQQVGIEFIESSTSAGLVIGKGDLQAADPTTTSAPGGIAGLGGGNLVVLDKDDYTESNRFFGDGFTGVAFHEIGHALGLDHAYDVPATQGAGLPNDGTGSNVQPGDNDLIHLQRILPSNSTDIDLYRFNLIEPGTIQIETSAERLATPSLLNTVLRLFRKNSDGTSVLVAQNDRYYGSDSLIDVELPAGEYFFGVSSAGNDNYDPAIANSGFGGTTDGRYEVQISFTGTPTTAQQLTDIDGTPIDGDGDGTPGGVNSFWFESNPNAIIVDKLAAAGGTGTIASPFNSIGPALAAAQVITAGGASRALVRIVGNMDENSPTGLRDATPYLVGSTRAGSALADGNSLTVPKGTTVRIEAGALIKLRAANIDVGTSSIGADRSGGAIQVLGTPTLPVYLRSYHDDQAGGDSDGNGPAPNGGDYGGIVLREDSDLEASGIFLSTINHADIRHGGGKGTPTGTRVFSPIDISDARPTITFNTITDAAKAAISASPNSFDDSLGRIGPDILGNYLRGNTDNGLFVGIPTDLGSSVQKMTVSGRFDDTDITHILTESLIIVGNPGGPISQNGVLVARPSGRLMIDPGTVIKLREARIESERGAATLIAEGTANSPIIFTSLADSRYGGSGDFKTNSGSGAPVAGNWGGLFFGEATRGSLDHTVIAFGGGVVPTAATAGGASDLFNAIEIHQADVRIANSLITDNASGNASSNRFGRGNNQAAAIYVRGAQPIIVDNQIVRNDGPAININANSLQYETLVDRGRSIGAADRYTQFDDNRGPLIRLNKLDSNNMNGLKVRGEELATQSVWDDSDIVHVLDGQISIGNHHTYSGLRLQSNVSESLVVKVSGANSGFTATGDPLDIVDRIGGTIQVIGLPGYPVVITQLADDSVGAGFTPDGHLMTDTNNGGGAVGNQTWQGFKFDQWSNDRNVAIIREAESPLTGGESINSNPITKAQPLGVLAPDLKSGDENRRLGFQVHGYISPDDAKDQDVYSFQASAGTQVWIDIDRTNTTLDTVFDVVLDDGTSTGVLVFSSDNPIDPGQPGSLTQEPLLGGDFYSLSNNDPGASLILVATGTYYVRVRAAAVDHDGNAATPPVPVSKGEYQLQVRLRQIDEFPGSTVRYADVRYASTAFDVQGLPRHSPLVGDAAESGDAGGNVTSGSSQELVNLLETDTAAISLAGSLGSAADVDVYEFNVGHAATQVIPGVTTDVGTVAVVFDMDYADKKRGDTSIAVFDENSRLIFIGRESNIADDQPAVGGDGQSLDDLSRGSLGTDDPSIGPVHLIPGQRYFVAVMSNQVTPSVVASQFAITGPNGTGTAGTLTRLEPINSVDRVVEDHIGFTGYLSSQDDDGGGSNDIQPTTGPLLEINTSANLDSHVAAFRFEDVGLFLATDQFGDDGDNLYTVDPKHGGSIVKDLTPDADNLTDGANDIQDIVIRGDGVMYGYRRNLNGANTVGQLVTLNPFDGTVLATQNDNIPGVEGFTNVRDVLNPANPNARTRAQRAAEVVNSDEVDAVTFRRVSDTGGDAPAPRYETFYSVRESDNASRLYRGSADGNAAPAIPTTTTNRYGFIGDIQPAGVTFAQTFLNINNAAATNQLRTEILLRSNVPGEAGNFTVNITRGQGGNPAEVSFSGNTLNVRLREAGDPLVVNATANDIVNAINNNAQAKLRLIALIYSGNDNANGDGSGAVVAVNASAGPAVGVGTAAEVLQGRVTGLSMSNFDGSGSLYGVTSGGEFISVSQSDGRAIVLNTVPGVNFTGLALGPQNVEDGAYKNLMFATSTTGRVYAFDTAGELAEIFGTTGAATSMQVTGTAGTPVGLAFSPLDFNLWHPTMRRANDVGHGINQAPDASRNQLGENFTIPDGITGSRNTSQGSGGASFYFGLEQWRRNPNADFLGYLSPTDRSENSQYGLNSLQHQDLSSNTNIRNTYDLAGGARGSLTTNEFSLANADYYDRPTLYLNYLLETEAATGKNVSDVNADSFFRDSARIYASRDNGATWELLATNNSTLSGTDAGDVNARAELPTFLSHVADAGLNSETPQPQSRQIVQELFDENHDNPLWHQARIDLSPFAGETSIKLRFDFSTSGSSIEGDLSGDFFGDVGDADNSVGGSNNNHEGFYIDDIIVGFAERGEMVTSAPPTTDNAFVDLSQSDKTNVKRDENALTNQLSGAYQLEMRRAGEYAYGKNGTIVVGQTFDTNVRHILSSSVGTGLDADRNKQREQGLLILENNILSDSRVVGVRVTPPAAQGDGNGVTFPGPVQNFSDKDDQRLVPGVVIQNNIIVGSSGVDYAGQPNGSPQSAVPNGRIINNTFIGNGGGQIGVNIHDNASPTLLNNVFSTLGNGIVDGGVGAVIDNNYFHNAGDIVGSDPRSGTDPLFVDPAGRNYYPLPTAGTINNSQDVLNDRGAYAAFKNILGIPQSPYFAPTRDVFGQLRVSGGVGGDGAGPNTDTDIGAADYSDFVQPYAKLLNPVDQDDAGLDSDPADTFIQLNNPDLQAFSVLLSDGENSNSPFEGTGIDPDTVSAATVLIRQDNRLLKVGRDFNLAFNPSTGELRLTPLSDLWNPNSVYEIILLNGDQKAVSFNVSSGNAVSDGDKITVSNGSKSTTFEFDSGYVVQLGAANTILDGQTFEYSTATGTKGYTARFQINKLATTAVGEFTGEVGLGRVPADDDVTIHVTDPNAFAVGDFIRISDEIMAVVGVDVAAAELTVERGVLGTPRLVHQAGALSPNRVELVDQEDRAVVNVSIGSSSTDDSFVVLQGSDLGLDATQLGLAGKMTFLHVNDEFMRVTGYEAATGRVTVQRGALGSKVTTHPQFSIAEVVDNSRSATLSPTQTVILDDVLLDGTTAGPLTVTGSSLLASDRVMEVTPNAAFVPKIGDLLQIGAEIVKIIDIQPGTVAGDLSLGIDRGLFDTVVGEHTATTTEMVGGVSTTYPTSIRLIDSAFVSITIFASDPLNDVLLPGSIGTGPGQVQSGIASKIARAMREFQLTQPGTAGDLDLRLPHAQGIEGGRIYLGGHVGDTIAFSSGSAAALSASLVPASQPGVAPGAIAVPYIPSIGFTQAELNAAVLSAINNNQDLGLSGVSEGGDGFYLVSKSGSDIGEITVTSTASGFSTNTSNVHGIADKAGNLLRPNRSTQTRFTIGVGPTAYDFGDGVDTADPNNRARHTILGLGDRSMGDPRLGSPHAPGGSIVDSDDISGLTFLLVDVLRDDAITPPPTSLVSAIDASSTTIQVTADTAASFGDRVGGYLLLGDEVVRLNAVGAADTLTITRGQLGSLATGHSAASTLAVVDDENGLDLSSVNATFNVARTRIPGGGPVMINVLATDYGVVDGWIDFNHNGKLDIGDNPTNYDERVFNSVAVWPGENLLPVNFPTTLPGGATITGDMVMRLRISKLGGLSADGLAIGGEVEDHKISIVAGVPPMLTDLDYNTTDGSEPQSLTTDEHVLGGAATGVATKIFNASTDADGNAISILEIVDPTTGRAYPVNGETAVIEQLHDSLGRLAGSLSVSADSTIAFVPRTNYDTSPLPGPDKIPGTADDVIPTLGFRYRLVDSTRVKGITSGSIPLFVKSVNQPPSLDPISLSTDASIDLDALFEDQDLDGNSVVDIQSVTLTGISAGAGNVQPVRVSVTTTNLADNGSGTFVDASSQAPLLITNLSVVGLDGAAYDGGSSHARLNFTTTPDQYGTASITVTVTDPGADGDFATAADNLVTSRVVTVTVAPVNDKPATVERLWTKTEAAEGAGDAPIDFAFTAADLAGTSGVANPFENKTRVNAGGSGAAPFNESNQLDTLTVSKLIFLDDAVITYTRTNASGSTVVTQSGRTLRFADLYDATGLVTYSDVTVKFSGSDGETGTLVVKHALGQFTSGVYTPKVDVNNNYDGIPQELQYVISDSGVSIAPKVNASDPDVQLGVANPIESNPEIIRFSILPKADSPVLGDFQLAINIDETEVDSDPSNDSYTLQLADLFTAEDQAFLLGAGADETGTVPASWITITANAGNPTGLLTVPTINQTADNDPISLTFTPLPNSYGVAEFAVTITNPNNGLSSATKTLAITVNPTNDAPQTSDRVVTGQEDIAYSFDINDLIHTANNPSRASQFVGDGVTPPLYDESEQDLIVYGFKYLDTQYLSADYDDGPGVDVQQLVELPNGDVLLTFRAGVFFSGTFTPDPDYFADDAAASVLAGDVLEYMVIDAGNYDMYGPGTGPNAGTSVIIGTVPVVNPVLGEEPLVASASITFLTEAVNDEPTIPAYMQTVAFYEDQPASVDGFLSANIFANPTTDAILPGPLNEVPTQSVLLPIEVGYVSGTTGMLASNPILNLDGTLSIQPLADAFGTAVYEITLTDSEGLTTTPKPRITISIAAVNDRPIAHDRLIVMDEAIEPATVSQTITADDLILGNRLNRGESSEQPAFNAHPDINPLFAEPDTLEVAEINVPDQNGGDRIFRGDASEPNQVVTAAGGVLTLTFAPSQSSNVPAGTMRFVSAVYVPAIDYNETSPSLTGTDDFRFIIRDSGLNTTVPSADIQHRNLSEPATARIRVLAQNDPPTIPAYTQNIRFYEDQPTSFGGVVQTNIFANPATDLILPGPANERTTQTMVQPITLSYVSGTTGMLSGNPTLSLNGNLSVMPVADAFGTAVYEITLTDSAGATTTPKPRVTITIDPINDKPVAFNRSIIMDEAVEPATVSQTITADDLLLGNRLNRGETTEKPAINAHEGINPLFRENDLLEIAEIIVPDGNGNSRPFRGSSNEPSQVVTAAGGTLTLTFAPSLSTNVPAGTMRFVSAIYTPAIDYNQTTPYFRVTDDFQFTVRDGGFNTTDQDAQLQHRNLSEPASARISVVAKNDPPIFPTLEIFNNTITFNEIEVGNTVPQRKDVYVGASTRVQAGPATAIDELALQQSVSVRFVPVAVPAGLMASLPTMTNDGVIEVHPNADAFGDAVYDVIATDGILDTPAQRITIAITGTNDAPTASTYAFTTLEDQPITIHDIAINEDLSAGSRASSLPVNSPFNESGQDLQVVGIGKVDPANPAINLPTPFVLATSATIPYAFNATLGTMTATQQVKTPHGTLDVSFQQRVNGELASGFISKIVYTPDPGYNDTLPDDAFTYFVSDYGSTPVPGSNPARELVIPADVPSRLSPPARISVSVGPVNTPPTVPDFENNGVFAFDEDATIPDTIRTQVFLDDSLVIDAGGGTDEADQTVRITLTANDTALASQLFSAPPTLSADGTLQVFPNANAFGTIVYTLSVVDLSPEGDVLTNPPVTKSLTLFINSVNDQPTAEAKSFALVEHREAMDTNGNPLPLSDGNGYRDIAASTLLLNNASGGAAQPSSFVNTIDAPFNEAPQLSAMRVIGLGLPGSSSPLKSANDPALVYTTVSGVLVATDTLETANGTLTITYQQSGSDSTDKFVQSIRYTPDADYNSAAPFDPTDTFTYFVDDRGVENHLSAPATVTMSVTPTNDLPFIPTLRSDTANSAEYVVGDEGGPYTTNIFSTTGAVIMPGPAPSGTSLGARDENADSIVHIELQQISGPTGMFNTAPTLTDNGTLTLDADPDAFGSAVYDIVVSERDLDGNTNPALDQIRRQRITITLSSENDAPSAPSRMLEMLEFSELENVTGDPVAGDPTLIAVDEERLLDLAGDFEGPALAGGSIAFPEIQTLHVTGIGLPGNVSPTISGASLIGDYSLNPETGQLEATDTITLTHGVLTVTFVEVSAGGETERYLDRLSYVPEVDYNTATPGTTPDQFTYFVTDSGTPAETSAPALVTLRVNPNNDVPTFTVNPEAFGPNNTLYSPIRNDNGTTTFPGLVSDLSPGPQTAADEQANQTVVFRYQPVDSVGTNGTDLTTLFRREPDLIDGVLYLYPANNASGTATLVFRADDGPDSRLNPNTKYQELTLRINIGSAPAPDGPIRTGTYNNPAGSGVAIVDLNDVFISVDGLNLDETEILTNGANGVASINPTTGNLEYRPNPGHIGEDIVIIQVQDNSGVVSGAVEIQFNTTNFRLTNAVIAEDVNRSGLVTSLDALLIINLLNAQENGDGVPISSIVGEEYFYDVSDNAVITSLDALRVINYLNEQDPGASSEPLARQVAGLQSFAPQQLEIKADGSAAIASESVVSNIDTDLSKLDGSDAMEVSEFNVMDLIAIDREHEKTKTDAVDSWENNLDAAISDLF